MAGATSVSATPTTAPTTVRLHRDWEQPWGGGEQGVPSPAGKLPLYPWPYVLADALYLALQRCHPPATQSPALMGGPARFMMTPTSASVLKTSLACTARKVPPQCSLWPQHLAKVGRRAWTFLGDEQLLEELEVGAGLPIPSYRVEGGIE